jgi:hypothetical protein
MIKCKNCVVGLLGVCSEDYCRQEREVLIEQAQQAAEQGGHTLTEFIKVKDYAIWQARCVGCNWLAAINLNPPPNEADVYGEAVTTACPEFEGIAEQARSDEEVS